jgi:glyoxylase-like metal-dependent hydrolase (beta-lactamase superfamily II)
MESRNGEPLTPSGVRRIPLPCGVNGIEFTNAYVIPDGDKLTVVDPGVWQPEPDDHGLGPLEEGLNAAGYAIRDISRIVVTHAHVDHYGMAGRIMEITGAELWMHAMTDLDTEKYRHPETAAMRRRDMYNDHGLSSDQVDQLYQSIEVWMPYLYSVVEASKRLRGDETLSTKSGDWRVIYTPGHSLGHICLYSKQDSALLSGDHLLPGVTPPVTFERGFDADPLKSYLDSLARIEAMAPDIVLPGHGTPFQDATRRIQAIQNNKARRLQGIRDAIEERPRTASEIASRLFEKALLDIHKNLALTETLAHIAYLRWSGVIERRIRPDGAYEWFAVQ